MSLSLGVKSAEFSPALQSLMVGADYLTTNWKNIEVEHLRFISNNTYYLIPKAFLPLYRVLVMGL